MNPSRLPPLDPPVPVVQGDVRGHHQAVCDVEPDDRVQAVEDLVKGAEDVAREDDVEEGRALAAGGAGPPGAVHGKGPGRPETDEHQGLEDAHFPSSPCSTGR